MTKLRRKRGQKFDLFRVPKTGSPQLIDTGLGFIQARKAVKQTKSSRDEFVGFLPKGSKPTSRSEFSY